VATRARGRYVGKRGEVTGSTRGKRVTPSSYVEEPGARGLPPAVPGEDGED
jgi:hypothetical protein